MRERIAVTLLLLLLSCICLGRKYCHVFVLDKDWAEEGGWMPIVIVSHRSVCWILLCISASTALSLLIPYVSPSFSVLLDWLWLTFLAVLFWYIPGCGFPIFYVYSTHMLSFFQKFVEPSLHRCLQSHSPFLSWLWVRSFCIFIHWKVHRLMVVLSWSIWRFLLSISHSN